MKTILFLVQLLIFTNTYAQEIKRKIITSDIENFWNAYDSIQTTENFNAKTHFINSLYIDKASKGLKAFMKLRNYNDSLYLQLIAEYSKFWKSVRANTLSIKSKTEDLNNAVNKLALLYPGMKDSEMYFTVGGLRSGGTTLEDMVLIGAEIATANAETDVSEFKNDWLKNVFKEQSLDNIISLNIHEYIHTQQSQKESPLLLSQVIREGACDFITELVLEKPLQRKYISYGKLHYSQLKSDFKREMLSTDYKNWLYNGGQKGESADLGYFIGYEICKSFYNNAKNKSKAIQEIIELEYSEEEKVRSFLTASRFYN